MTDEVDNIFKNYDVEKGEYIIGKLRLKFKDISVDEYEAYQDKFAEMEEMQGKELSHTEAVKVEREWIKYTLQSAFGKDVDIIKIRNNCNASSWKKTWSEVSVFLIKFSGMEGLRDYITTLKANVDYQKKTTGT